ncbi:MAG TPA: response regulator transcription factor [Polyangiales bacterium]|nr:response regulator transcription factor [Polyangiales bacterium]
MAQRILLVEDDTSIVIGLRMNLEREGYEVELAEDGDTALERVREGDFDLVLLDVMLPKRNGYEVLDALRKEGNHTPVLMLSARSAEMDKVMGLDLGADDYIPKPFSVAELLARVRAGLRRGRAQAESNVLWRMREIDVDPERHQVRKAGKDVELTAKEFEVLMLLKRASGRVLSRQAIFDRVWGDSHHGTLRTIDNFISQLRSKLEDDPASPRHLLTVRGVGYRLDTTGNSNDET